MSSGIAASMSPYTSIVKATVFFAKDGSDYPRPLLKLVFVPPYILSIAYLENLEISICILSFLTAHHVRTKITHSETTRNYSAHITINFSCEEIVKLISSVVKQFSGFVANCQLHRHSFLKILSLVDCVKLSSIGGFRWNGNNFWSRC